MASQETEKRMDPNTYGYRHLNGHRYLNSIDSPTVKKSINDLYATEELIEDITIPVFVEPEPEPKKYVSYREYFIDFDKIQTLEDALTILRCLHTRQVFIREGDEEEYPMHLLYAVEIDEREAKKDGLV